MQGTPSGASIRLIDTRVGPGSDHEPITIPIPVPRRAHRDPVRPTPVWHTAAPHREPFSPDTEFAPGVIRGSGKSRSSLIALAAVLMLLVLGAGGWWWATQLDTTAATTSAAVTPAAQGAAPAAPAPDPGPMLLDQEGQLIPSPVARAIRVFYQALDPLDPTALDHVTQPGQRREVRAATTSAGTRATLREVMRTTRLTHQDEGLVYRGSDGLQIAFGPETALLYDLILPGSDRATSAATTANAANPAGGTSPSGSVPTLGDAGWSPGATGYGQVRPSEANANGDGTSVVTNLRWKTWGGPTATGTGIASWVRPDGAMSDGVQTPAVVTASDLGACQGHLGYRKITWYFPSRGETAATSEVAGYPDICTPH